MDSAAVAFLNMIFDRSLRRRFSEDILTHHQSREAIGQSIHSRAIVGGGVSIWPDNVEARIDQRDSEGMEGGVSKGK